MNTLEIFSDKLCILDEHGSIVYIIAGKPTIQSVSVCIDGRYSGSFYPTGGVVIHKEENK